MRFGQLLLLFLVGYVGGIALYQYFPQQAVENVLTLLDPRITQLKLASWMEIILPNVLFLVLFVIFISHPILRYGAIIFPVIKAVILGIGSMYLVNEHIPLVVYSLWWFPFAILSCIIYFIGSLMDGRKAWWMIIGVNVVLLSIDLAVFLFFVE